MHWTSLFLALHTQDPGEPKAPRQGPPQKGQGPHQGTQKHDPRSFFSLVTPPQKKSSCYLLLISVFFLYFLLSFGKCMFSATACLVELAVTNHLVPFGPPWLPMESLWITIWPPWAPIGDLMGPLGSPLVMYWRYRHRHVGKCRSRVPR